MCVLSSVRGIVFTDLCAGRTHLSMLTCGNTLSVMMSKSMGRQIMQFLWPLCFLLGSVSFCSLLWQISVSNCYIWSIFISCETKFKSITRTSCIGASVDAVMKTFSNCNGKHSSMSPALATCLAARYHLLTTPCELIYVSHS